jgi:hypothetical protein
MVVPSFPTTSQGMNRRKDIHPPRLLFHMAATPVFSLLPLLLEESTFLPLLLATTTLFLLADVTRLRAGRLNLWVPHVVWPAAAGEGRTARHWGQRRLRGLRTVLLGRDCHGRHTVPRQTSVRQIAVGYCRDGLGGIGSGRPCERCRCY